MKLLFRCVDIHKSAGWACFFMRSQPTADAGVHCPHTEVKLYITNPDNLDAFILGRDYPLTLEQESHETAAAADVLTDPFPQESIRVSPGSFTVENNVIDGPQGAPSQDALAEEDGAEGVPVLTTKTRRLKK